MSGQILLDLILKLFFFKDFMTQYLYYGLPFNEDDLGNNFFFMRKFTINYLLYKKYAKVLSTYIDGMFKANNKWVNRRRRSYTSKRS